MKVPAVQVTDRLAELAHIRPYPPRKAGVVDVALLDPDLFILEGEKDLGLGIRVEVGLEGDPEFPGFGVEALRAFVLREEANVTGRADLGVEQVGAARSGRGRS